MNVWNHVFISIKININLVENNTIVLVIVSNFGGFGSSIVKKHKIIEKYLFFATFVVGYIPILVQCIVLKNRIL